MKHSKHFVICGIFFTCLAVSLCTSTPDVITLPNGCVWNNTETDDVKHPWFTMSRPLLNCSHLGLKKLDFTGVPNTTVTLDLSYNELTTLKASDFVNFTLLERIELKQNKLVDLVASDEVKVPSVVFITLSHNKLREVPHDWLKNFPDIQILTLYSNEIDIIKSSYFEDNKEIKILALGPNPIRTFESDWLGHVNLTSLVLNGMNLQTIPTKLSKMSSLRHLSLTGNEITEIEDFAFKECSNMKWMQFANNKIKTVGSRAFAGMYSLTSIDLSDNKITTLPSGTFNDMKQERVEVLLFENPLNCNCDMQWFKRWTDELESEDLSTDIRYKCEQPLRNHGKKTYDLTVADFTCADDDEVWVDCNKPPPTPTPTPTPDEDTSCPTTCVCYNKQGIQYYPPVGDGEAQTPIPKNGRHWWIKNFPLPLVNCENKDLTFVPEIREDVGTLMLGMNKITKINLENFKNFQNLNILDLDDNKIKTILPSKKSILKSVIEINIRSNYISNISVAHLASFPNLRILRMYDNRISVLDRNVFSKSRYLTSLWIGPNPIKKFDDECLRNLKLTWLDLRGMNLTSVPSTLSGMTTLQSADLSDNYITEIKDFSIPNALLYLKLDNNRISKISEKAFRGATRLRQLDLSENNLELLPEGVFDGFSRERLRIELWQNPISCNCSMKWFKEWIEEIDAENPMAEIRFVCFQPERVHGQHSDTMRPDDFTCKDDDHYGNHDDVHQEKTIAYTRGQMAAGILLTLLFTFILTSVCCRCFCGAGRNKRVRYSQHANSSTQLDLDMD